MTVLEQYTKLTDETLDNKAEAFQRVLDDYNEDARLLELKVQLIRLLLDVRDIAAKIDRMEERRYQGEDVQREIDEALKCVVL